MKMFHFIDYVIFAQITSVIMTVFYYLVWRKHKRSGFFHFYVSAPVTFFFLLTLFQNFSVTLRLVNVDGYSMQQFDGDPVFYISSAYCICVAQLVFLVTTPHWFKFSDSVTLISKQNPGLCPAALAPPLV